MHLTTKQLELMRVIAAGNPDGSPTDLDQILDRINYETTKASLQFSIRALLKHGLIEKGPAEKRRGRKRVLILVTGLGASFTRPSGVIGAATVSGAASISDKDAETALSALSEETFVDADEEFLE